MKKYIACFLALVASVLFFACASPPPPSETMPSPTATETKPPEEAKPEAEEIPNFPLIVTDDLGRKLKIDKLPQRIVSLAPSNTLIIYALGLEDKIVGTTDYCDYPEAAKSKPRVSGYTAPNMEKVVS